MSATGRFEELDPGQRETTLARAKEAVVGEMPTMPDPPDNTVKLFRGLYNGSSWDQRATVKELTGSDEEGIARMQGGGTSGFLDSLLTFGVASVGHENLATMNVQDRRAIIDQLLVGEKELLFLNVLRVSYGDSREISVTCPSCEEALDVSFLLSEIPVRDMDDPFRQTYEFATRDGTHIEYRLVNGSDNVEADKRPNITLPESNTILLSRCITTVNGKIVVDPLHYARQMGVLDRRNLLEALTSHQPGPYFEEVKLPCAVCGAEARFTPTWADLL